MKYVKRTPFSVRTRTRYARLRFTNDPKPSKDRLQLCYVSNCDCSEEGIQTLPEWAPVYNKKGNQYMCSISNPLEVGARKAQDEYTVGYEDWYYMISRAGAFFIYVEEVSAFYTVGGGFTKIVLQPLMGKNGSEYALMAKGRLLMVDPKGEYEVVISKDVVPAGVLFRHRLFVGMKNGVVQYSAPEDYRNFTESVEDGGKIRFADGGGEIIAMKVYDDALYVFFASGIMRLEVGGDPCEFRAEKIDYTGGNIFARTICICDHAIYFMTQSGVYRLKGKKPERLDLNVILPNKESGYEGCAVWKGLPLFRYKETDETYKTFAIRADGSAYYMKDLVGLSRGDNGKVLFTDSTRMLYQLVESGQGTVWEPAHCSCVATDFGYVGRKTLRKLCFIGEGSMTVNVDYGHKSLTKTLTFENGRAEWPMSERGDKFQLHFVLNRASKVREVIAEFETVTSYKEDA